MAQHTLSSHELDRACGLLRAAGQQALSAADPSAGLRCLHGAESLCAVGAVPPVVELCSESNVPAAILEALRLLADLPEELFGEDLVLDACADAHAALGLMG